MRNLPKIVTGVLLLFILFTAPSTAEITSVKLRSDNRHTILFEKFGFTQTGHVSIAISSVSVTAVPVSSKLSQPDPSRIGFFLVSDEALTGFRRERTWCDLDSKYISLLFTFQDLSPPPQSSFNKSHTVTFPSDYSLFFANCNPLSYVTMDVLTEFYNTDINGTTKDYLSAGLTQLPSLYYNFYLIYMCFLGFWIAVCFKKKISFNRSHLLMGVLLVMKTVTFFCAAKIQYHVKATGNPLYGWDVMFYIFQLIQAVVLYIVMSVISDGWYLLKPKILKEKKLNKVLMVVILVQVLATVASIVGGESGPFAKGWMTWNMVLLVVQAISCYFLILPLGELIWFLIKENGETDHDVKAAKKYLIRFFVVVFGYVFVELMCVFCVEKWVSIASVEITTLVFYMVMFCMFRPFDEKNKCFQLKDMEEEFEIVGYPM